MSDVVDNLEALAHASDTMGKHASAKIIRQGIAEIEALRRRLELQREKLPNSTYAGERPTPISPPGTWELDWRNLPEAP